MSSEKKCSGNPGRASPQSQSRCPGVRDALLWREQPPHTVTGAPHPPHWPRQAPRLESMGVSSLYPQGLAQLLPLVRTVTRTQNSVRGRITCSAREQSRSQARLQETLIRNPRLAPGRPRFPGAPSLSSLAKNGVR